MTCNLETSKPPIKILINSIMNALLGHHYQGWSVDDTIQNGKLAVIVKIPKKNIDNNFIFHRVVSNATTLSCNISGTIEQGQYFVVTLTDF